MALTQLFLIISVLVFVFVSWREARRAGFSEERWLDMIVVSGVGGLVGGFLPSLTAGLLRWRYQALVWGNLSFSWSAAILAALFVWMALVRKNRWSLGKTGDLVALAASLSLSVAFFGAAIPDQNLIFLALGVFSLLLFLGINSLYRRIHLGLYPTSLSGVPFLTFLIFGSWAVMLIGYLTWGTWGGVGGFLILVSLLISLRRHLIGEGMKMNLSKDFLKKITSLQRREERQLRQEQLKLEKEDPYLQAGRAGDNAELMDDVEEDVGKTRTDLAKGFVQGSLTQVRKALSRLKRGRYGVCELCHQPIDKARLKAYPQATTCLKCSEKAV